MNESLNLYLLSTRTTTMKKALRETHFSAKTGLHRHQTNTSICICCVSCLYATLSNTQLLLRKLEKKINKDITCNYMYYPKSISCHFLKIDYLRRGGYAFIGAIVCLFVNRITQNYSNYFSLVGGKVAHGPWNKSLEFGGNTDHVTLGLR